MFNTPIDDIKFATVQEFCALKIKERLDLDYKKDWPADLERVMCAMANVQGGMILIGIDEDGDTRQPAWPPIGVEGTDDKLHQRVIQIAYDAIYPPVIPEIAVCRLQENDKRAVIVIRVEASRLLHAVDGRRKIYVRVDDQSRGYELAKIDEIEWLWDRRNRSIELRLQLISRAEERAKQFSDASKTALQISITPPYPHQVTTTTPAQLVNIIHNIGIIRSDWTNLIRSIPQDSFTSRTVAGGAQAISSRGGTSEANYQYMELGEAGLVYLSQVLDMDGEDGIALPVLRAFKVLAYMDIVLTYAAGFYENIRWAGPLLLQAKLTCATNTVLDYRSSNSRIDLSRYTCPDSVISLCEREIRADKISLSRLELLTTVGETLAWAFGYSFDTERVKQYLARLIPK